MSKRHAKPVKRKRVKRNNVPRSITAAALRDRYGTTATGASYDTWGANAAADPRALTVDDVRRALGISRAR